MLHLSLGSLASKIRTKQISPIEVTQGLLERIDSRNDALNAYITVLHEEALAAASRAEKEIMAGNVRGTLHGVPVGLKDIIYTKSIRTTMGSQLFQNWVPDH